MAAKKVKVWTFRDVKRIVEGLFAPGERKALFDAYGKMGDLVMYGKRPVKDLHAIQSTEWRLIPLPEHVPVMAARLSVITTRMSNMFTVIEVRGDGWRGQPSATWYGTVAQEINRGPKPVENPSLRSARRR
jgi:hypothetical protein